VGNDHTAVDEIPADVDLVQHLQRAGVHDGSARRVRPDRGLVERHGVDAARPQRAGHGEAGRSRADDHDIGLLGEKGRAHGFHLVG